MIVINIGSAEHSPSLETLLQEREEARRVAELGRAKIGVVQLVLLGGGIVWGLTSMTPLNAAITAIAIGGACYSIIEWPPVLNCRVCGANFKV